MKRHSFNSSAILLAKCPLPIASVTALSLAILSGCAQQDVAHKDTTHTITNESASKPTSNLTPVIQADTTASSYMRKSIMPGGHAPQLPFITPPSNENYSEIERNSVKSTREQPFATLSLDTDTGSYANVRRFLNNGSLPPKDSVRIEELINYFNYDFGAATKKSNAPFLVDTEVVKSPWHATNRLIKVGIKAEDVYGSVQSQPPANLVFLVDVSGSMNAPDKLQLAKSSLKMLSKQLRAQDTITLVTYAGNTEVVLAPTAGNDTKKILNAIDNLHAGGSTNGEAAIKLAYQQAELNFKKEGINRILMLTDGDFNVGVSSVDDMLEIIKKNRDNGISLSTLGFGQGNYNDHMMEQVADNGNGNYSYIDGLLEAKKVLIDEMSATFNTVAKDVKIQVEFNPATVSEWRLIGYENRVLAKEDFNNDKVDAGELGAGKSVVALFEVTPLGQTGLLGNSRYQTSKTPDSVMKNELGYLKIRYKVPQGSASRLIEFPIHNRVTEASADTNFAMAVAGYGQLLTDSNYIGNFTYADVKRLAQSGVNSRQDKTDSRREFVKLVELAEALD